MPNVMIDEKDVEFRAIRAPGPGGQNVNKVSSAIQLRFDAGEHPHITPPMLVRLRDLAGRRMTKGGIIVITAHRFRSQERNRADAIGRLAKLLEKAATPPPKRRPTRPGKAAKARRKEQKTLIAKKKHLRRAPDTSS